MKYFVDWSDRAFPEIKPASHAVYEEDLRTFAECKREITKHFQSQIEFAREMIHQTRALRARDVRE